MDTSTSWDPVREFVGRILAGRTTTIVAGTPEWCELADDDPVKADAVLIAGSRYCLHAEMEHLAHRRHAAKEAALEVAQALDWQRVAKSIRDRDDFYREHPYLRPKRTA